MAEHPPRNSLLGDGDENELLDVQQIGAYLKLSRATIQRWCRTGYLPAARVGKVYRVRRGDFERWFRNHSRLESP